MATVVASSVVSAQSSSGLNKGGWGYCWGAGVWPGSKCRCSGGLGGGSEAEGEQVVAVDNDVVVVDGSCAVVTSSDMAHVSGVDRLVGVSLACMLVLQVLGV